MKIVFATQNKHKGIEVQSMLGDQFEILSLADLNYFEELPETHFTLEENAAEKAEFVSRHFGMNCFSDDSGLEIVSLNNRPGVFSSQYAGKQKNAGDNISLVLQEMNGINDRRARFRTVICLILENEKYFFEGIVNGEILTEPRGNNGFGYDPVFCAEGNRKSFAEMLPEEKNSISHRHFAMKKMKTFLLRR